MFDTLAHGTQFSLEHVSFDRQSLTHGSELLERLMLDFKITLELATLEFDGLPDLTVKVLGLQVESSLNI